MSINKFIDLAGFVGKAVIEVGDQPQAEKEIEKLKVDIATDVLKDVASVLDNNRNIIDENWINRAKVAARKYGLMKVTILPGTAACGMVPMQICMYGGDTKSFCQAMNIAGIRTDFSDNDAAEIQQREKQVGMVIYEKDAD